MREKILNPLKSSVSSKTMCGFDIETFGQRNEYLMNSFHYNGKDFSFWNKEEFIEWLIHKKDIHSKSMIFATNLMFDFFGVFGQSDLLKDFSLLFRNGRLLCAKTYIHKGELKSRQWFKENDLKLSKRRLEFFDTLNFFPASVQTLGDCINFPKYDKPKWLGNKPKNQKQKDELELYCIRDSQVTAKFMEFLQNNINLIGGKLKITIPSTAMDIFKRVFLPHQLKTPSLDYILEMYKAYFGGRTEAFKRGLFHNLYVYDVNSLYPYCMKEAQFPHPNFLERGFIDLNDIYENEGIVEAYIEAPKKLYIPYLPVKGKKLLFPLGKFVGHYSFLELRRAEALGYDIRLKGKAIYSKTLFNPFADYVKHLWKLRKYWQKTENPAEIVAKLCLNSLYGKFGERITDRQEIKFLENYSYSEFLLDKKKGHKVEIVEDIVIVTRPIDYRFNSHVNPMLALYVTAKARDVLYRLFEKNPQAVHYCDTDSIFTTQKYKTGSELGKLKLEYKLDTCMIVKPKFYAGISNKQREIIKIKGARGIKTYSEFLQVLNTREVAFQRFVKFFESKRRKILSNEPHDFRINERIEAVKQLSLEDDKRQWHSPFNLRAGDSSPVSITPL